VYVCLYVGVPVSVRVCVHRVRPTGEHLHPWTATADNGSSGQQQQLQQQQQQLQQQQQQLQQQQQQKQRQTHRQTHQRVQKENHPSGA
jgi:hypothetical protein